MQLHMPATACLHGQWWSWFSDLWAPPHLWHLTESLLSRHALEALLCPRAWQREHCISIGLSIHLLTVTSFPKRAAWLLSSVLVMEPSGSKMANVMVEYTVVMCSTGLSHLGCMAKKAFFSPGIALTSFSNASGLKW